MIFQAKERKVMKASSPRPSRVTAIGLELRCDNWIEFSGQKRGKSSWEKHRLNQGGIRGWDFRAKSLELK